MNSRICQKTARVLGTAQVDNNVKHDTKTPTYPPSDRGTIGFVPPQVGLILVPLNSIESWLFPSGILLPVYEIIRI